MLHTRSRTVRAHAREAWNTLRIASSRDYGLALAASLVSLVVSLLATSVDADDSVAAVMFLSAVGVTGWFGGLGPALAGTIFGAVAIDYFFETPPYQLAVTSSRTIVDLVSFFIVALLLGTLNARVRVSHDQLRAERDRAQAAVRSRDDLMAMVSHELRTPLTTIKTSVYSLRIRAPRLRPDKREHLLATIESEADRLVHFVTESLALRKLEHTENPQWELCAPCEVASAVLDRCLPSLGSRKVEFAVGDDLPLVRIDPFLTAQALGVLLENVAMHTPPDARLAIQGAVCGRNLEIAVSDAGPGIPPDARERVFARYERLDQAGPGLGLGLAIARAAVEVQGGRLWVDESSIGGARFALMIPDVLATDIDA